MDGKVIDNTEYILKSCETYECRIYVAGDPVIAREVCAKYAHGNPICVSVSESEYIYYGGRETGVIVGIILYPRFQDSKESRKDHACRLAQCLIEGLHQLSATVSTPEETIWMCRGEK